MNQEKEMAQIVNPAYDYTAPKVKVVEVKARRLMCQSQQSGNYLNDYPGAEW